MKLIFPSLFKPLAKVMALDKSPSTIKQPEKETSKYSHCYLNAQGHHYISTSNPYYQTRKYGLIKHPKQTCALGELFKCGEKGVGRPWEYHFARLVVHFLRRKVEKTSNGK